MSKKLIIFADYGLDDAAATVTVLKNRMLFESITIVPIGGNVPVGMSFRNCVALLDIMNVDDIDVIDATNVDQSSEYMAEIHGNDGMGDIFETEKYSYENNVYTEFGHWIDTLSGDEILLSLGPMTIVKKVLEKYPECQLVLMGGCVDEEPNFNGYEFNHALDVEAFNYCVKFPHVAITLDTCRTVKLDMRRLKIKDSDIHSKILCADQELSIKRGEDGCYVWDDIAACYLIHPNRFKLEQKKDICGNILTQAKYISDLEYFE